MPLETSKTTQSTTDAAKSETAIRAMKVKAIVQRGIAKSRAMPPRSPKEIWEEFDAVWNKIASQYNSEEKGEN